MDSKIYDIIILGGGPAGLSAGIYASRSRLNTLMIEKGYPGGQLLMCEYIENFPGFHNGTDGMEFASALHQQAEKFGMLSHLTEAERVDLLGYEKLICTTDGKKFRAKSVILCLGARARTLEVKGEFQFLGKGVSYCAVCDGALFQGKKLAVIGGGDTAVEDSLYLTKFASEVHIIHRRDKFRAQKIIQERAFASKKIKVHWNSTVDEIYGEQMVKGCVISDVKTDKKTKLDVDGVFVLIGNHPNTAILDGQVTLDSDGYIITNENMATNIPGVFAAGDVRHKLLRQIITATADGAIAAVAAEKFIEGVI